MKKIFLFIILAALFVQAFAKIPKKAGNVRNSMASILVYKNGELLRSGIGVLVNVDGEMLSSYSLFVDADSAVAIDTRGVARPVIKILGADETYDCIRLSILPDKKLKPVEYSSRPATNGNILYMVGYGVKKSGAVEEAKVEKTDTISGSHYYYTLRLPLQEKYISAPLVNAEGELVALLQSVEADDTLRSHALAANYAKSLTIRATNYNSERFSRIGIRKALPATEEEALSCLLLQSFSSDSVAYKAMLDEYVVQFPQSHQGHLYLAEYNAIRIKKYDAARAGWEKALALADNKGDVLYHKANTIYAGKLYADTVANATFPIDTALACVNRAIEVENLPIYVRLKGNILYTKRDYAGAFECYSALTTTNLCDAEVYAIAANCKELLGDPDAAIQHLDSAIATFGQVPIAAMAPYVLNRGLVKNRAGRYREAVLDYNAYAKLLGNRMNSNFYYLREQAEYSGKMYRLALADIDVALALEPDNITFLIEKGRICYRVNMIDEALPVLAKAMAVAPENPDAYYLMARCQMLKGDNAAAKENLQKAVKFGHPTAAETLKNIK